MGLKEKRAAALKAALEAKTVMEADPSEANIKAAQDAADEVKSLDELLAKAKAANAALDALSDDEGVDEGDVAVKAAKSLGEHFVRHAGAKLASIKGGRGTVSAPEFKAASDTQVTNIAGDLGVVLTDVDRTIVQAYRRATITSLFGQGTISGQAITYFVEGAREGDFATVAEAGQMPQMHYADPTKVTDALSKLAGFIKLSDEMLEDLDFLVSEINGRLLYDLSLKEEAQVLSGDGLGTNLKGLLNRSGVQTGTATAETLADEIFRSMTKISNATGLQADGLVINPADYEGLRLAKDANEQYYGGGFFAGQYGVGGFVETPPVWGLRTVVSPAVAIGKPVVGAFNTAATVYKKGGVRVEATNSNEDDFTNGLVTVRGTKRLALAVRKPAAFVKLAVS